MPDEATIAMWKAEDQLPIRDDGRIDWAACKEIMLKKGIPLSAARAIVYAMKLAAMNTMDRCARVVDAEGGTYNEDDPYERGMADGIDRCFNAINKLET